MQHIIRFTANDLKVALADHVNATDPVVRNSGITVTAEMVNFLTEHHGQYEDVELEFTGVEIHLPDTSQEPEPQSETPASARRNRPRRPARQVEP